MGVLKRSERSVEPFHRVTSLKSCDEMWYWKGWVWEVEGQRCLWVHQTVGVKVGKRRWSWLVAVKTPTKMGNYCYRYIGWRVWNESNYRTSQAFTFPFMSNLISPLQCMIIGCGYGLYRFLSVRPPLSLSEVFPLWFLSSISQLHTSSLHSNTTSFPRWWDLVILYRILDIQTYIYIKPTWPHTYCTGPKQRFV